MSQKSSYKMSQYWCHSTQKYWLLVSSADLFKEHQGIVQVIETHIVYIHWQYHDNILRTHCKGLMCSVVFSLCTSAPSQISTAGCQWFPPEIIYIHKQGPKNHTKLSLSKWAGLAWQQLIQVGNVDADADIPVLVNKQIPQETSDAATSTKGRPKKSSCSSKMDNSQKKRSKFLSMRPVNHTDWRF